MNIRERIIIAYGGLLILLLILAGMSLSLTSEFGLNLKQAAQDNTRIIRNATAVYTDMPKVATTALFSTEEDRKDPSGIEVPIGDLDEKFRIFSKSLRIPETDPEVQKLQKLWKLYVEILRESYQLESGNEKTHFWEANATALGLELREQMGVIINNNLVLIDGEIVNLRDRLNRDQIFLLSLTALGVILCIGFLGALGRFFVKPARDLVDAIDRFDSSPPTTTSGAGQRDDEIGAVAGALERLLQRVRESRQGDANLMRQLERRSEHAMDCIPDGIYLLDRESKISYLNNMARKLSGAAPVDAPVGIPWPPVRLMVERCLQTGKPEVSTELDRSLQIFVDGDEKFYLPRVFPLLNDAGFAEEIVVLLSDVSYLRQLDEMKVDLVATVSHQLKTPLTSVRMSLHMLKHDRELDLSPMHRELLLTAFSETERLQETIQNLLDMARIQAGAIEMAREPIDTTSWLRETAELYRALLKEKDIDLFVEIDDALPILSVDKTRMMAVIDNLMTNCAKYCNSGDTVKVRATEETDFKSVAITVSDTGPGISKADLTRIFEKFYRGPHKTAPGVGLGLAIARRVVIAHGGDMTCYSNVGQGTTFTIVLYQ